MGTSLAVCLRSPVSIMPAKIMADVSPQAAVV
jgi:hypothetical protein